MGHLCTTPAAPAAAAAATATTTTATAGVPPKKTRRREETRDASRFGSRSKRNQLSGSTLSYMMAPITRLGIPTFFSPTFVTCYCRCYSLCTVLLLLLQYISNKPPVVEKIQVNTRKSTTRKKKQTGRNRERKRAKKKKKLV